MGLPPERVQASLRFSLGRSTTEEDVDQAAEAVMGCLERQRRRAAAPARS
jgi:cysteine sulfinate desulfinase/cysteine desulfurase-like protein